MSTQNMRPKSNLDTNSAVGTNSAMGTTLAVSLNSTASAAYGTVIGLAVQAVLCAVRVILGVGVVPQPAHLSASSCC